MTATTRPAAISGSAATDRARARRALVPAAAATLLLAAFFMVFRADTVTESLSMIAFDAVVTAGLLGLVVPRGLRHESAGGRALAMAVLGLLLAYPAFWSGLPLSLGVAAMLLGYAGKRAATRSGLSIAALVVGSLAALSYVAILVGDWIAHPAASWVAQR